MDWRGTGRIGTTLCAAGAAAALILPAPASAQTSAQAQPLPEEFGIVYREANPSERQTI